MDVSSIATAYAAFGGVLVGFAFTGLSFYVTRSPGSGSDRSAIDVLITRRGKPVRIGLIQVSSVAATGFYAMASLGISTFLYANLSGSHELAGQAETALLVYGIIFALSVLTLFYFMTLMLFECSLTRHAAKPAFWAGTIAGSIVVLRFLAGSAQHARLALCSSKQPQCYPGAPYTTEGVAITLLAAAVVFVVITLTRILECRPFRWLLAPLAHRPSLPSAGVFLTSVAVATLTSLYLGALTKVPPDWFISASYIVGIALILLFALASGSVIYPRLHSTRLTVSAESQELLAHTGWLHHRIKVRDAKRRNILYIEHSSGCRPTAQNGHLMWKTPPKPAELETSFKIWHEDRSWRLGGQMFLADTGQHASLHNHHRVLVTLKAGCGTELSVIDERTLTGPRHIQLGGDQQPPTSDVLHVAIQRLDSSADDVLLCWLQDRST
jgi:hypothetical protein